MEKKELIGRKVRGFMYDPREYFMVPYRHDMLLACVGCEGEIVRYDAEEDSYLVSFQSNRLMVHYPAVLIDEEVIDEEPKAELKKGDYIRGFKFEDDKSSPLYATEMDSYIGKIGQVVDIVLEGNMVGLVFAGNYTWYYPLDQALEHRAGNNDTTYTVSDLKFDYGFYKNEPKSDDPLDNLPLIGDGVLMEVSNDGHGWSKRYVFGKRGNIFFTWDTENYDEMYSWAFARPIQKTKITRKEFESKFEIID